MLLTVEDLSVLTGRTQPAAQIRWLESQKWIYGIGSDGLPKVASAYFERRMVLGEGANPTTRQTSAANDWKVNVEALRQHYKN